MGLLGRPFGKHEKIGVYVIVNMKENLDSPA
jgi:hypothetical protein